MNASIIRTLCFLISVTIVAGVGGQNKDVSEFKSELLSQTLVDKVWLYELMLTKGDVLHRGQLLKSYEGFLFQIFVIEEVNGEEVSFAALRKAVHHSPLTKLLIEEGIQDPLSIRSLYRNEILVDADETRFGVFLDAARLDTLSKYEELCRKFRIWLKAVVK